MNQLAITSLEAPYEVPTRARSNTVTKKRSERVRGREEAVETQRQPDLKSTQTQTVLNILIFSAAAHTSLTVYRTHEYTMPNLSTGTIYSRQNEQNGSQSAKSLIFQSYSQIKDCVMPLYSAHCLGSTD
jgi:hypothetical protein